MSPVGDRVAEDLRAALSRGWIDARDVHEGVRAWDASRSHDVTVVEVGDAGLVVKRYRRTADDDVQGSRARELAAYRAASTSVSLADVIPTVISDDPGGPLVVERVRGTDLATLRRGRHRHDGALLTRVAAALGRWHRATVDVDAPPFRPWILDAFSDHRPSFLVTNEGARAFIDRAPPDLAGVLRSLADRWRVETLVHGDLRPDNVIVDEDREAFIDWETAGQGDPAWDLGSLLSGILADAGIREVGGRLTPVVRDALHAVVAGYATTAHPPTAGWDERLGLACAARLAQRAVQVAGTAPEPDPEEDRLAALACQLGAHPSRIAAAAEAEGR